MSRVAYSASKSDFMHDWENNLFMDKMREGARNNHIGGSPSEVNSWQNNAAKIYNLLKLSGVPADVFVAFEYKSPLAGRVDCMLFAMGNDGKKHIVHINDNEFYVIEDITGAKDKCSDYEVLYTPRKIFSYRLI